MNKEQQIIKKFIQIEKNEKLYYELKNNFKSETCQEFCYFERTFYNDGCPKYNEVLKNKFFDECLIFLNNIIDLHNIEEAI